MWRAATAVAQRHWGGGSRCNSFPDLAFQGAVRTTPALACAPGFPPWIRREALVSSCAMGTGLLE